MSATAWPGRSLRGCPCPGSGTARRPAPEAVLHRVPRSGPAASRPARRPGAPALAAPSRPAPCPRARHPGWPGRVRSGSPSRGRCDRPPPLRTERGREREASTPAAQITVRAGIRRRRPSILTPSSSMPTTVASMGVTPGCWSERSARWDSYSGNAVRTRSAFSMSSTRPSRGSISRKSSAGCPARAPRSGRRLHPGRAGADDHEREQRPPVGIALDPRRLERAQGCGCARPARSRATSPQARSRATRRGRSTNSRAAGDDQGVVGHPLRRDALAAAAPAPRGPRGRTPPPRRQHADVLVAAEDRTQRRGDLPRGQRSGRDLVGERLEQVEVAPVDQRDLDVRPRRAWTPGGRRSRRRSRRRATGAAVVRSP